MVAGFTTVLAYRFGAPLLLGFLSLGLLVGEDELGLKFNDASLAYLIGSLACGDPVRQRVPHALRIFYATLGVAREPLRNESQTFIGAG